MIFTILVSMHETMRPAHGPCGRLGRAMTRCECVGVTFDEVARLVAGGRSFDEAQVEAGAGLLCSACLPDLHEHVCRVLASARAEAATPPPAAGREPVDPAA